MILDYNETPPLPPLGESITTYFNTWCKCHFKLVFVRKYDPRPDRYRMRCPMCLTPDDPGHSGVQYPKALALFGEVRVRNALDYDWFSALGGDEKSQAIRTVWRRVRYEEYLNSEQWRTLRNEVMDAHDHKCARCGGAADHVHHLTYERLGNERLSDLIPVCAPCHYREHGRVF